MSPVQQRAATAGWAGSGAARHRRGRGWAAQLAFGHRRDYHKVHDAFTSPDSAGQPVVPLEGCQGAVLLLRHPADVAVSLSAFAAVGRHLRGDAPAVWLPGLRTVRAGAWNLMGGGVHPGAPAKTVICQDFASQQVGEW